MHGFAELTLTPETDADRPFLLGLYHALRAAEFAPLGWSPDQLAPLLNSQFEAQRRHYRACWPTARYEIVRLSGEPIGRLYVDGGSGDGGSADGGSADGGSGDGGSGDGGSEVRILDITLLEHARQKGIGGALLRREIARAHAQGQPVRLHVARSNPARTLYERLGFRPAAPDSTDPSSEYVSMECHPAAARTTGSESEADAPQEM